MAHYVKNAELREELIKSKELNELTPTAIKMVMLMADRFFSKLQYVYSEDKEDCKAFAIMDVYLYWRSYNPEKSKNAFAYVTQILKNGASKGWRKVTSGVPMSKKISISRNDLYNI